MPGRLFCPGRRGVGHSGFVRAVARAGKTVKMARSLDRPMRYFLAKRQAGRCDCGCAHRHDFRLAQVRRTRGQFHPSYTRMVPAHHVVEMQLIGCPDPDPVYTRFFTPASATLARRPRRHRPQPTSVRSPKRSRSGSTRPRTKSPSASASPAASTAAASFSRPTMSCASSA